MADKDRTFSYTGYLPQPLLNIFQGRKTTPDLPQPDLVESRPLEDTLADLKILPQLQDAYNQQYRPIPNSPRVEQTDVLRHSSTSNLSRHQHVPRELPSQKAVGSSSADLTRETNKLSNLLDPESSNRDRRGGSAVSQTEEDLEDEVLETQSIQDDSLYDYTPVQRPQGIADLPLPQTAEERIHAQFRAFVTPERQPLEQDGLPTQEHSPITGPRVRLRRGSKVIIRKSPPSKELWQTIPDEPNAALSRSVYVNKIA
jgi:hypothetical protein